MDDILISKDKCVFQAMLMSKFLLIELDTFTTDIKGTSGLSVI